MNEERKITGEEDVEGHRILPLDGDVTVPRGEGDRIAAPQQPSDEEDVEGHWGQAGEHIPPPKMDK
ncbi:MAG TPA: hypothetical protein VNP97_04380 [Microbacterium sp.]|nr:hypothetical protein [Microbacterium sp.]